MKKIISSLLAISFIFSTLPFGTVCADYDDVEFEDIPEEKIYCEATIEQDFDDSSVLVVMDKSVGSINKTYDEDFFGEVPIESIVDLTAIEGDVESLNIDEDTYRQILEIKLPEDSKDNVLSVIEELENIEGIKYVGPNYVGIPGTTPNDSSYGSQWGLSKIKAPQAWDITRGSRAVKVGILDTGITSHSDLNANMTTNLGWNFIDNNNDTSDSGDHGTHVAGIAGAVGNNSLGISGVCWNVNLVPLKFNGTVSQVSEALTYAMQNDISIVNMSWWNFPNDPALSQAISNYTGLFVCISGNAGTNIDDTPNYPASFKHQNMIVVGSTDSNDSMSSSSNYGKSTVDLFAPGVDIYSTVPTGYATKSGTSMAAPHVAGVAALIKSIYPNSSTATIKNRILGSVDAVSSLNGMCKTGGRLNAYKAIKNNTISLNAPMSVKMDFEYQKSYHEFTAPSTDYYTFRITTNGSSYHGELTIYDSTGNRIYGTSSLAIQQKLTAGQKYHIESTAYTSNPKNYTLTVYDCTSANGAIRIARGTDYSVNILSSNQKRWYVYRPSLAYHKYTAFSFNNGNSDPTCRFYKSSSDISPALTELAYSDDIDSSNRNFSITDNLLSGTDYYFETGCFGTGTGSYTFKIDY